MSRIGRKPIAIPKGVQVGVQGQHVEVQGPKGRLALQVHELCSVKVADGSVVVGRGAESRTARALHAGLRPAGNLGTWRFLGRPMMTWGRPGPVACPRA